LTNPQDGADATSTTGEVVMIRKTVLALVAPIALGAAALAPTSASAWGGWGHGSGWGHHWGYGGPRVGFYGGFGGCNLDRWVPTPYGPVLQRVNVCY
jgi:hypothetical protein